MNAHFKFLLRLGDTALILAQRNGAWCGHGPFLEEDLALTNIALDLLGRTEAILTHAGIIEGKGRTADQLSFHRSEREFYNALLVEQPNGDYAQTILRQYFVDVFDLHMYDSLCNSKDEVLAGIAAKSLKEVQYHVRHSSSWVKRFALGTEESSSRLNSALENLWRYTGDLFEPVEEEAALVSMGISVSMASLHAKWKKDVMNLFDELNLMPDATTVMQSGSTRANHTEHLGFILAEMQILPRSIPQATW